MCMQDNFLNCGCCYCLRFFLIMQKIYSDLLLKKKLYCNRQIFSAQQESQFTQKMQGDIFGWRQTEDTSRLDKEDSQWTVQGISDDKYAWDPWTKRAYIIGRRIPFTVWCWELGDIGWWGAFMFLLGSILFVLGSTAAIFKAVYKHEQQQRWLFVWPYFIGSIFYTVGCALLVTLSVLKHPRKISVPGSRPESPLLAPIQSENLEDYDVDDEFLQHKGGEDEDGKESQKPLMQQFQEFSNSNSQSEPQLVLKVPDTALNQVKSSPDSNEEIEEPTNEQNITSFMGKWKVYQPETPVSLPITHDAMSDIVAASYVKDEFEHIKGDPWYLRRWYLDLSGALIIGVGSILYNLSCGTEAYKDVFREYPDMQQPGYWLIKLPNIIGGICFVVGSAFYVLSVHRSWSVMIVALGSVPWWILLVNLIGSAGFLLGAAVDIPVFTFAKDTLIGNWLEVFVGYVIGSSLFLIGSYLMIIEIGTVKSQNHF
eukprot:TRINITY_DN2752_c0_g1_i10.p1 TRINITY_DN2752_c0_g1~~TRINITY_DN2752_c0_g1_i10.p1  ORF type:complete len:482 (-),score=55.20 TRINITY_DN2752_c0_g1_i10:1791-3236(-)